MRIIIIIIIIIIMWNKLCVIILVETVDTDVPCTPLAQLGGQGNVLSLSLMDIYWGKPVVIAARALILRKNLVGKWLLLFWFKTVDDTS